MPTPPPTEKAARSEGSGPLACLHGPKPEPPSTWSARDFASREVGILSEQGGLERARVLLGKGFTRAPQDPDLYLDAIRLERGASQEGRAWRAWLVRALDEGAPIAQRVTAIVPERELRACLLEHDARWAALARQGDGAHELLRMRLLALLHAQPFASHAARALEALEDEALLAAAPRDRALRVLALGALCATAWRHGARSTRLGARLTASDTSPEEAAARARLDTIAALAPSFEAACAKSAMPRAIERVLALLGLADRAADRELLGELRRDLRAEPNVYLRAFDALAGGSIELALDLEARLERATESRAIASGAESAALERIALAIVESMGRGLTRFLSKGAVLYGKHARPAIIRELVEQTVGLPELIAEAERDERSDKQPRELILLAARDPALRLFALAAAGPAACEP